MKKYMIILFSMAVSSPMLAQSIQRSVLGTAGKIFTSGTYKLSFTLGEVATARYVVGSGVKLNQGFQQGILASTPLPIIGLEFTAIRLNDNEVQLTWKTLQEINCKGFYLQRQLQNENSYSTQMFVASKADGGNSSTTLNYLLTDINSYNGYSYYRLKQEDLDGKFIYSVIRSVEGTNTKGVTLRIWPIPANNYFNVQVNGITKNDEVLVFDLNGKIVQQLPITNYNTVQVRNLLPGYYMIRLASDRTMSQKVMLQ